MEQSQNISLKRSGITNVTITNHKSKRSGINNVTITNHKSKKV